MSEDIRSRIEEQQEVTAENLHNIALGILDAKESVEEGSFASASEQLKKLKDAVGFTETASSGLALVQEAADI